MVSCAFKIKDVSCRGREAKDEDDCGMVKTVERLRTLHPATSDFTHMQRTRVDDSGFFIIVSNDAND